MAGGEAVDQRFLRFRRVDRAQRPRRRRLDTPERVLLDGGFECNDGFLRRQLRQVGRRVDAA